MDSGNTGKLTVKYEETTTNEIKESIAESDDSGDAAENKYSASAMGNKSAGILVKKVMLKNTNGTKLEETKDDQALIDKPAVETINFSSDKPTVEVSNGSLDKLPKEIGCLVPNVHDNSLKKVPMSRGTSTTVVKVDMEGGGKCLRVTSTPLDDGSKVVKIEADSNREFSDSKDDTNMQYIPSDMSAKERVENLKENLEAVILAREKIQDELMEEINSTAEKFVQEAKENVSKYNKRIRQVVEENKKFVASLRQFLLGKILYIPKFSWQKMIDKKPVPQTIKSFGYKARPWSKKQELEQINPIPLTKTPNITLLNLAKRAFRYVPTEEQRKTEAVVAMVDKSKVESQRMKNARVIVEFFPWMTFVDAEVCLKCNDENLERVQNFLVDKDQFAVLEAIEEMKEKLRSKEDDMKMDGLPIQDFTASQSVACKVIDFSEDCSVVTTQLMLDRNRIPLKSGSKRQFRIIKLLSHKWYFTDEEKFEKELIERQLNIQYQIDESSGDMIPLKLYPAVRYAEYKFNWNNHSRKLKNVSHQQDGEILFKAKEVDTHIYDDKPLHIYTQVIDESSVNILMILITDTRENISVESFNLTNSDKTVEDFMTEFRVDVSGKKLNYRIIVKDRAIKAILAPTKKPGDCKRMKFLEQSIPSEGSLISTATKIGVLKSIPTGLVVTTNSAGIEKKELQFKKRAGRETWGRHISDLAGFVDVHVLVDEEELLPKPREEAWNVCEFEIADQGDKDLLQALQTKYVSANDCDLFEKKIDELVAFLANTKKNDDSFKVVQEKLTEIRKLETSDDVQAANLPQKHKTKLRSFVRELRLMKLGSKIVPEND